MLSIPKWLALGLGQIDDIIENKILRKEPIIPLEGVNMVKRRMYVSSQKAIIQLGLPQSPVDHALSQAIQWFRDKGYY